ncbi:hypothetical protein [Natronorubrum daqingense]|uniref:Uncharacterized protein n=1 Tax=Natronorubrum daqingense TaxID=588898 RepID=A0A1N6YG55_9EURY|nr:hypothetical protein [Natronorubrum daqingense]APX95679.1 hypothetical protein BB347_03075 [Natronorubrum daqingense]SIR13501.1 hypothetical protein SAMN05421809_0430 [Natronorubrum daqingense]
MSFADVLVVSAVAMVGVGIVTGSITIVRTGMRRVRTVRTIRENGPTPVGELTTTTDPIRVDGIVRAGEDGTLEAPLSGDSCVAYAVDARSVVEASGGGERAASEHTAADVVRQRDGQATGRTRFVVEDEYDAVSVDPANATLSLSDGQPIEDPETPTTPTPSWVDEETLSAPARRRLEDEDLLRSGDFGGGDSGTSGVHDGHEASDQPDGIVRQYRERRLGPGDDVSVLGGRVTDSSDSVGTVGYDESAGTVGSGPVVTVSADEAEAGWFEISNAGYFDVLAAKRRTGTMYVLFGGLLLVPGLGFSVAGLVGLLSTLVL